MNKLTNWIKHHQIAAFFIITFAITWGLGFSYDAVMKQGQDLLAPLAAVATCGPALAGIIISAVSNTQPKQGTCKAFWIAFCVAWIISALVFTTNNTFINQAPLSPVLIVFSFIVVVPVALVISMAYSRIPAVKNYLSSLARLRGVWGWALLALVWTPVLVMLSTFISSLLGRQPIDVSQFPVTGLALIGLVAVKFFYQFFFFNATGEEVGWRGFAQPRLQAFTSPLTASLVIAFFWIPWHFSLWKAQGAVMTLNTEMINSSLLIILSSIITGWFYNRSRGSILVAGIDHAVENTFLYIFFSQPGLDYIYRTQGGCSIGTHPG